jgi:hypothetical protein
MQPIATNCAIGFAPPDTRPILAAMTDRPDNSADDAIRVLADAVHRERVPGIVEFHLLERALETASVAPSTENMALAAAAFHALDPDLRQRIIERARSLAHAMADQRREAATMLATLNRGSGHKGGA